MEVITSRNLNRLVEVDCLGWGPVRSGTVAFSPDGSLLSLGSETGVRLLRADDLQEAAWLRHRGACRTAFSPDGRWVATADHFGIIKLWDAAAGKALRDLVGHSRSIWCLAFSGDSHLLASRSTDRTVRVWPLDEPGDPIVVDSETASPYAWVLFAPNQPLLAMWGRKQEDALRLYDLESRRQVALSPQRSQVRMARFSPDGRIIATTDGWLVRIWDCASHRELRQFQLGGDLGNAQWVDFTSDGRRLVMIHDAWGESRLSQRAVASIWDVESGQEIEQLDLAMPIGVPLAFAGRSDAPRYIPWAISPSLLREWSSTPEFVRALLRPIGRRSGLALTWGDRPRRAMAAYLQADAIGWDVVSSWTALVWGSSGWASVGTVSAVTSVALSVDSRTVAGGYADGSVRIWDLTADRTEHRLAGHAGRVTSLAFAKSGELASCGEDGTVRIWDTATQRGLRWLAAGSEPVDCLVYAPDARLLVAGSRDGLVRILDALAGKLMIELPVSDREVTGVAFAPNGEALAAACRDGTVRIWDAASWRETHTMAGRAGPFRFEGGVAFLPDGRTVVSGSCDGSACVWDVASGELTQDVILREARDGPITVLSFATPGSPHIAGEFRRKIAVTLKDSEYASLPTTRGRRRMVDARTLAKATIRDGVVALSVDGRMLVSGGEDGVVRLWGVPEQPS